jgi:hypothetical protein
MISIFIALSLSLCQGTPSPFLRFAEFDQRVANEKKEMSTPRGLPDASGDQALDQSAAEASVNSRPSSSPRQQGESKATFHTEPPDSAVLLAYKRTVQELEERISELQAEREALTKSLSDAEKTKDDNKRQFHAEVQRVKGVALGLEEALKLSRQREEALTQQINQPPPPCLGCEALRSEGRGLRKQNLELRAIIREMEREESQQLPVHARVRPMNKAAIFLKQQVAELQGKLSEMQEHEKSLAKDVASLTAQNKAQQVHIAQQAVLETKIVDLEVQNQLLLQMVQQQTHRSPKRRPLVAGGGSKARGPSESPSRPPRQLPPLLESPAILQSAPPPPAAGPSQKTPMDPQKQKKVDGPATAVVAPKTLAKRKSSLVDAKRAAVGMQTPVAQMIPKNETPSRKDSQVSISSRTPSTPASRSRSPSTASSSSPPPVQSSVSFGGKKNIGSLGDATNDGRSGGFSRKESSKVLPVATSSVQKVDTLRRGSSSVAKENSLRKQPSAGSSSALRKDGSKTLGNNISKVNDGTAGGEPDDDLSPQEREQLAVDQERHHAAVKVQVWGRRLVQRRKSHASGAAKRAKASKHGRCDANEQLALHQEREHALMMLQRTGRAFAARLQLKTNA